MKKEPYKQQKSNDLDDNRLAGRQVSTQTPDGLRQRLLQEDNRGALRDLTWLIGNSERAKRAWNDIEEVWNDFSSPNATENPRTK